MNSSVKELLANIVSEMVKAQAGYPSASFSSKKGVRISKDDREERISHVPPEEGIVLRIVSMDKSRAGSLPYFEEVATSQLDKEILLKMASSLSKGLRRNVGGRPIEPDTSNSKKGEDFVTECKTPPSKVSLKEKVDYVRTLHAKLKASDRRIVNVNVNYSDTEEAYIFADKDTELKQNIILTSISFAIFVHEDGRTEYNWFNRTGTGGFELTNISDSEIEKTKDSSLQLLNAERLKPGSYDVITSPTVSGVIAHEAFGHGVEADMFLKDRARGKDYIGKPVASEIVNMCDDPSIPGAAGSYFFDHEGKLSEPTIIIKNGILDSGLTDLFSSISLGIRRSANGRRESFKRKVYVRMSNTFFERGKTPPEEMIREMEHGIYLEKCESGMEDPKGWGIQVTAHIGREIRNGKFTGRVYSPVGITGYVPDLLKSISQIGNDFELEGGGCGKGHKEYVRVSTGGPHLRMKARLG